MQLNLSRESEPSMSATRDPSEKITFLFTPMGKLVQKIRETQVPEQPAPRNQGVPGRSRILKSDDLRQPPRRPGLVREYRAREISNAPAQAWPATPAPIPASLASQLAASNHHLKQQRQALEGLGRHLHELQEVEKRLQFMLLELEDLLKD